MGMNSVVSSGIIVVETSSPMRKLSDSLVEVNGIPVVVFHHIDPFSSVKFRVMTVDGGSTSDERINEKKNEKKWNIILGTKYDTSYDRICYQNC